MPDQCSHNHQGGPPADTSSITKERRPRPFDDFPVAMATPNAPSRSTSDTRAIDTRFS